MCDVCGLPFLPVCTDGFYEKELRLFVNSCRFYEKEPDFSLGTWFLFLLERFIVKISSNRKSILDSSPSGAIVHLALVY